MTDEWQIPAFELRHARPKSTPYALCIFVINEGEKLRRQLAALKSYTSFVDVIIADGGSTDDSYTNDILNSCHVNALLVKTGEGKLSAQMRMALAWCLKRGYDGILVMDGNGKDGLEAIPRFVEKLKEGYDHIQGSRFIKGGRHENTPVARYLGLRLLHAPLISFASGFHYTDTTNGFRAYSAGLLQDPHVSPFRDCFREYELHYYLAIKAARYGFKCTEIPVSRCYPSQGKTPTKIKGLSGNLKILRTLFDAVVQKYDVSASAAPNAAPCRSGGQNDKPNPVNSL